MGERMYAATITRTDGGVTQSAIPAWSAVEAARVLWWEMRGRGDYRHADVEGVTVRFDRDIHEIG